jgi:transketolase C-terminal domain/subunit
MVIGLVIHTKAIDTGKFFTEQGSQTELYQQYGLTAQGIIKTIQS